MRFGMVMPLYVPDRQRLAYALQSLPSLARTSIAGLDDPPALLFVVKLHPRYDVHKIIGQQAFPGFETETIAQPEDAKSVDGPLLFAFGHLLRQHPDLTHVMMLAGDWLYNRFWLLRLRDI